MSPTPSSKLLDRASAGHVTTSSRSPSKFLSRVLTLNPIKSSGAAPSADNGAAMRDFQAAFKKTVASYREPSAFAAAIDAFKHMSSIDDRKMALEHLVSFMSKHADGILKDQVDELQNKLIELLYDDLYHPPATYLGSKYSYRTADGSYNNICDPKMGKADEPYARSVQQTHPLPLNMLPDAGLVFDTLLKREKFNRHPAGLSSFMFSFAALVTHTVFRTSHKDVNINETSSYVDLSPLYGNNEETLNKIRVRDGRGLILPDTFTEDRLLLLPPAVCVLLVLFNRNHNYIANKLLEINERCSYINPDDIPQDDPQRAKKLAEQDEDIFQTTRLINCSWFGSVIFSDYFHSILGLVRQGTSWSLISFGEFRDADHKLFERGRGNVCSVEFNCLYRWHATTSQADEKWAEQSMGYIFPHKPIDDLTIEDLRDAIRKIQKQEPDLSHLIFGNLKRGPDGRFKDSDLASIIKDAIEHPAAAFGARGTPHIMRLQEIMGIESSRRWGVCSLNDFRKFICLKPYSSFLEWNSNPEIAEAAEHLYGNIDNLELYVGLQAEEAKPVVDGSGLCPGYTISRAILSDAFALTRGDRFFTSDYTPFNLTSWGFADCQRDPKGPGNGSMLGRLILRSLPEQFTENSTYTWFPFQTPESMKIFLANLGTADRHSFNRPSDPPVTAIAGHYNDVQQILGSNQFRPFYGDKAALVVSGGGFFFASNDDSESQRDQREILRILQASPDQADKIAHHFYERTRKLVVSKSYILSDKRVRFVNIIGDVLRYVPLYWTATELAGLTLKVDEHSPGDYTESQLYDMITDIYSFLFLDADPSEAMSLDERVKEHIKDLRRKIKANILEDVGGRRSIAVVVSEGAKKHKLSIADSLFANGASVDRTTNNVLSLLVGASVELSQSLTNVVNFYLDQPNVVNQLRASGAENPALEGYIYEAMRIDPPFRGVYRESLVDQTIGSLTLSKGQRVFVDLLHASHDPHVFSDPSTVNLNREPKDRYLTWDGVTRSLGVELMMKIMSQVLRAVFEFEGIRRGPGLSGTLKRYKVPEENALQYEYLGTDHLPTVWPNTMVLQYDVAVTQTSNNSA